MGVFKDISIDLSSKDNKEIKEILNDLGYEVIDIVTDNNNSERYIIYINICYTDTTINLLTHVKILKIENL